MWRGVELAGSILKGDSEGPLEPLAAAAAPTARLSVAESVALIVEVGRLEKEIERRLLEAMETVVPRRRGRPPRKERRGTR